MPAEIPQPNPQTASSVTQTPAAPGPPSPAANDPQYQHIKELGEKLGIDVPPDIMSLGSNEAISETLVSVAVQAGKSEQEIAQVLGG